MKVLANLRTCSEDSYYSGDSQGIICDPMNSGLWSLVGAFAQVANALTLRALKGTELS